MTRGCRVISLSPVIGGVQSRQYGQFSHNGDMTSSPATRIIMSWFFVSAFLFPFLDRCSFAATFDDLKGLEITCFVPSYLPQGLRLKKIDITYDEIQPYDDQNHPLPLYSVEYRNGWSSTFTIESAREGIGDRNILPDEENADETEIKSPFGPMYLIYRPK